jgi:hypothetical protein
MSHSIEALETPPVEAGHIDKLIKAFLVGFLLGASL